MIKDGERISFSVFYRMALTLLLTIVGHGKITVKIV